MNSIIKRLGKICLGLGVMLVPVLGFGQSDGLQKLGDINKKHQEELVTRLSAQNENKVIMIRLGSRANKPVTY